MLTRQDVESTLLDVYATILGHEIECFVTEIEGGFLLQVGAYLPDNHDADAEPSMQKGGKLYVSQYATHHELVLKVWQAVQAFVLHEIRETFYYRQQAIFHPHVDVDALADFTRVTPEVTRPEVF